MKLTVCVVLLALCVREGLATCSEGSVYYHCGGSDNGTCIHVNRVCDGNKNCADGWDELSCSPSRCSSGYFSCNGRDCVHISDMCNGVTNCANTWDEKVCTGCKNGAFHCDATRCVAGSQRCDGVKDCSDGSDEDNCTTCSGTAFLCDVDRCITAAHKCDGEKWCRDRSDEDGCKTTGSPVCRPGSRCDGVKDACSWDDEHKCTPDMCQPPASAHTYCDGRCLNASRWCDGVPDCSDGADEAQCRQCNGGAVFCDGECKPASYACDGFYHRKDGRDEANCKNKCKFGAFLCDGDRCVHWTHRCDGNTWCRDEHDEMNCNNVTKAKASCASTSHCNGVQGDCWTGDDEVNCSPNMCQAPASNMTYCDGHCLDAAKLCNGVRDCTQGEGEAKCTECNGGAVPCDGVCIPEHQVCDGYHHCKNGRDELNCTTCQNGSFSCDVDRCVREAHRCDSVAWCHDASDEASCHDGSTHAPVCSASTQCDGVAGNCWTGDDEVGCLPGMCRPPASPDSYCDGHCLPASKWCDGVPDCLHRVDEVGCNATEVPVEEKPSGMTTRSSALVYFNTAAICAVIVFALLTAAAVWKLSSQPRSQQQKTWMGLAG